MGNHLHNLLVVMEAYQSLSCIQSGDVSGVEELLQKKVGIHDNDWKLIYGVMMY